MGTQKLQDCVTLPPSYQRRYLQRRLQRFIILLLHRPVISGGSDTFFPDLAGVVSVLISVGRCRACALLSGDVSLQKQIALRNSTGSNSLCCTLLLRRLRVRILHR